MINRIYPAGVCAHLHTHTYRICTHTALQILYGSVSVYLYKYKPLCVCTHTDFKVSSMWDQIPLNNQLDIFPPAIL